MAAHAYVRRGEPEKVELGPTRGHPRFRMEQGVSSMHQCAILVFSSWDPTLPPPQSLLTNVRSHTTCPIPQKKKTPLPQSGCGGCGGAGAHRVTRPSNTPSLRATNRSPCKKDTCLLHGRCLYIIPGGGGGGTGTGRRDSFLASFGQRQRYLEQGKKLGWNNGSGGVSLAKAQWLPSEQLVCVWRETFYV